jgi:hypothetical protein
MSHRIDADQTRRRLHFLPGTVGFGAKADIQATKLK